MERCNSLKSTFKICIYLLLFSLNLDSTVAEDPICKNANCGEGTCVASSSMIIGYDCECNEGWKQFQPAPLLPASCVIPNCSFNLQCGSGAPPSLPMIPLLNFSNPCNLVWCNNGECIVNGTGHYCQCQNGNENLFDNPALACFPQCAFGADCKNVELGPKSPPPPPSNSGKSNTGITPPSPSSDSGSQNTGSNNGANCLRKIQALTIIILSVILHA